MLNIRLSDASPGQRLARAVSTPTGTVLVQAGEHLTRDLIDGLRHKGIESVVIEGDDPAAPTLSPEQRLAALDSRFAGHEHHPLMMELKQVIAEQMSTGRTE
ncbi:MAG TPA: hypothetical protein VIC33_02455 [Vicinamibacterales bacterium]|jgi:hypothetical protein